MPAWSFTDNAWNPNSVLEWNNVTIVDNTAPTKPTFTLTYTSGWWSHTNGNWANKEYRANLTTTEANTAVTVEWKKNSGSWTTLAGATSRLSKNGTTWTTLYTFSASFSGSFGFV